LRRAGLVPALLAVLLAGAPAALAQAPVPSPAATSLDPARASAIENLVREAMEGLGLPGLSAAVAVDGQLVWTGTFGVADLENEVPVTPSTMFRLASVSKPITAVAVLQLVERGRVSLDDDVRKNCPAFPAKPWPVLVRHALDHQGGIRDYNKGEWGSTHHYRDVQDALAAFKDDPLVFQPGTRFLYSTYGYSLLGCVTEGATGQPFLDVLRTSVFAPAGMTVTRDDDTTAFIPGRAPGYQRWKDGVLRHSALADISNKVPGGGLIGTAADVARFGAALVDGHLVSPATFARMTEPQSTSTGTATTSGLGLFVSRTHGVAEAWHTGGQPQVSTVLYLQPERRRVVALLCNLESVGPSLKTLARAIADAAAP
jgi:serine beta-lactamase-like protein LACTB, mitochondrial